MTDLLPLICTDKYKEGTRCKYLAQRRNIKETFGATLVKSSDHNNYK